MTKRNDFGRLDTKFKFYNYRVIPTLLSPNYLFMNISPQFEIHCLHTKEDFFTEL